MMHESFHGSMRRLGFEADLRALISTISRACKYINFNLRAGNTDYLETENSSGESQLAMDVEADKIICHELEKSDLCSLCISEEQEKATHLSAKRASFIVAFDPLDGSSLFDSNLSIGSIFGIWEGDKLEGQDGNDMVAAVYCIYGPSVKLVLAGKDMGTHEFEMNDVGEFVLSRENIKIEPKSKYYAPGNLRACEDMGKYKNLIMEYMCQKRTLRYSGGMVPDLHHILSKKQGIFLYPGSSTHPNGKLRLTFECHPMALIFKEAGGTALTTNKTPILDVKIEKIHQRTTIVIGSSDDVQYAVDKLQ